MTHTVARLTLWLVRRVRNPTAASHNPNITVVAIIHAEALNHRLQPLRNTGLGHCSIGCASCEDPVTLLLILTTTMLPDERETETARRIRDVDHGCAMGFVQVPFCVSCFRACGLLWPAVAPAYCCITGIVRHDKVIRTGPDRLIAAYHGGGAASHDAAFAVQEQLGIFQTALSRHTTRCCRSSFPPSSLSTCCNELWPARFTTLTTSTLLSRSLTAPWI